jgi:hypothetical protein
MTALNETCDLQSWTLQLVISKGANSCDKRDGQGVHLQKGEPLPAFLAAHVWMKRINSLEICRHLTHIVDIMPIQRLASKRMAMASLTPRLFQTS